MDIHRDTEINVTNTVSNDKAIELERTRENEPETKQSSTPHNPHKIPQKHE
jgi:hypothetical protein